MSIQTFATLLVGVFVGLAITIQSAISGSAGRRYGAIPTGLIVSISAGLVALVVLVSFWRVLQPQITKATTPLIRSWPLFAIAGVVGSLLLVSISFLIVRVGVGTGLALIICSQLIFGMVFDAFGLGGAVIMPTLQRLGGLVLVIGGTIMIVWR